MFTAETLRRFPTEYLQQVADEVQESLDYMETTMAALKEKIEVVNVILNEGSRVPHEIVLRFQLEQKNIDIQIATQHAQLEQLRAVIQERNDA